MNDRLAGNRAFMATITMAFIVKLWLTSQTRIIAVYAPHDALNFLSHAKSIAMGHWFGPYDEFTLIKQPFFPMYMAAMQEIGLPLTIAHLLFYGLACFVACAAIKPLCRNAFVLCTTFVVLYFNPMENNVYSWSTTRSQVNGSLTLLALSCACALFIRRRQPFRQLVPWAIALGVSFAAFWLTREEAIWMVPALAVLACAFAYAMMRDRNWSRFRERGTLCLIPVGIWAFAMLSIMTTNGIIYGWFTTAENVSPEVVGAYNSMARINPGVVVDRHYAIPHAARMIAYRVSPAARELEGYLEGPKGHGWIGYGCSQFKLCDDIHVGWLIWAFRDSVANAGYYQNGATTRAFYVRLAAEIDAACDAKRIACMSKSRTLSPPMRLSDIPAIAADIWSATMSAVQFDNYQSSPAYYVGPPAVRLDYDFIVRSVDDGFGKEPAGIDDDLKRAILVEISHTYTLLLPWWTLAVVLTVLARLALFALRRAQPVDLDHIVLAPIIALSFLTMTTVLALVDTLAFPSFNADYMSPLFPVLLLMVALVTAVEIPEAARWVVDRLPPPSERVSC